MYYSAAGTGVTSPQSGTGRTGVARSPVFKPLSGTSAKGKRAHDSDQVGISTASVDRMNIAYDTSNLQSTLMRLELSAIDAAKEVEGLVASLNECLSQATGLTYNNMILYKNEVDGLAADVTLGLEDMIAKCETLSSRFDQAKVVAARIKDIRFCLDQYEKMAHAIAAPAASVGSLKKRRK